MYLKYLRRPPYIDTVIVFILYIGLQIVLISYFLQNYNLELDTGGSNYYSCEYVLDVLRPLKIWILCSFAMFSFVIGKSVVAKAFEEGWLKVMEIYDESIFFDDPQNIIRLFILIMIVVNSRF